MTERYRFFCGVGAVVLPVLLMELLREHPHGVLDTMPQLAIVAAFVLCLEGGLRKSKDETNG